MSVSAVEGTVENGQIQLPPDVHLPDKTKVIIVIPDPVIGHTPQILSPRLTHPEDAAYFVKEVIVLDPPDAGV